MEARDLRALTTEIKNGSKQLLESFLIFINAEENDLIFFKDFTAYLNKNILCLKPNIEDSTKSDLDLFLKLTDPTVKIILDKKNKHVENIENVYNDYLDEDEDENEYHLNLNAPILHSLAYWSYDVPAIEFAEYINILISEGADVNIQNKYAETPLMVSAGLGLSDFLQTLIDLKANVHIITEHNYNAADYAVAKNKEDCLRILFRHGAFLGGYNKSDPRFPSFWEKRSRSIRKLIKESQTFKYKFIEHIIIEKIDEATSKTLPTDLIDIIASYATKPSSHGYFKIVKEKGEERYLQQEFKETCTIM